MDSNDLNLVSNQTVANWAKRGEEMDVSKLKSRANKRASTKKIVPVEYLTSKSNAKKLKDLLYLIKIREYTLDEVIYSLGENLLSKAGKSGKTAYIRDGVDLQGELLEYKIPDEHDFIGAVYQSMITEGEKNQLGSYYTPKPIVDEMLSMIEAGIEGNEDMGLDADDDSILLLDPCCGTGSILISAGIKNPNHIFGIDRDPVACYIARVNLLCAYKDMDFIPRIECNDFLSMETDFKAFNIITNPPWGAVEEGSKDESFMKFFYKSYDVLDKDGNMVFLFPESILRVKKYRELREFVLENCNLHTIRTHSCKFTGVYTSSISMYVTKHAVDESNDDSVSFSDEKEELRDTTVTAPCKYINTDNEASEIDTSIFHSTENLVFSILNTLDNSILNKVRAKCESGKTLKNSVFSIGIMTGDNGRFISQDSDLVKPGEKWQALYTGKDICRYKLKPVTNYIYYDRGVLQQVGKESTLKASEKLLYKFISRKLVFAYDNKGILPLNSANVLIPKVDGMQIKTVLALLNSKLYQFIYLKLYGDIKVLKGNLAQLPFPDIDQDLDSKLSQYVDRILDEGNDGNISSLDDEIQSCIYHYFELTDNEIDRVRSEVKA